MFFYWSDFYWGEGQDRRPLRHLYHVPALELWRLSERQAQGEGVEADTRPLKRLKRFNERVNPAKQNAPGIAIIGASYAASHDFHETPPGVEMPGILLLANAVATMTLHGPIQEMGYWASALVTVAMIVLFSASLTWVTVWFGDWFDGWFSVRRARLVAWFQARAERDGRFRLFGVPVPQWLRSRCAGLADWTPNAQTPAFWLIILLFFLLTWFLLVEWKTWFNFTLTISFMYCLLEVRSAAMWWALALFGVIQLLL